MVNEAVREMIARYGLHDGLLPVPIRQVARDEGWVVQFAEIPRAYGYAVVVGTVRVMVINAMVTPVYQRFAIAHEIGHVLNRDDGRVHLCASDMSQFEMWLRSREERAASLTAATLLIPMHAIEWGDTPECIAARCGVPVELARLRLSELA